MFYESINTPLCFKTILFFLDGVYEAQSLIEFLMSNPYFGHFRKQYKITFQEIVSPNLNQFWILKVRWVQYDLRKH